MNNEIIEKIANHYKVDAIELIKHYNTCSTLNEDIRPEPNDILSYLTLMLLNKDQLSYGSLGVQFVEFIEYLYFSEQPLNKLGVGAYDNHGNELHVMEIIDNIFEIEHRLVNIPTVAWEAHLHKTDLLASFKRNIVEIFGENGYRIYNLFAKNSEKLNDFQSSINERITLYEREFNNKDKSFIFMPISIGDIHKPYTDYHEKTQRLYGEVVFKELTRYGGMYCLVYEKGDE